MHVCFVTSSPFVLNPFIAPAIRHLVKRGDEVTVVVNCRAGPITPDLLPIVTIIDMNIARAIQPLNDFRVLWKLFTLFRTTPFDIVHSVTPKAGLLTMLAALGAGVPTRIHTFTGQVWATRTGAIRWFLRSLDKVLAFSATSLLADSSSQRHFLIEEGIARASHLHVLANGSITGVDTVRFAPSALVRSQVRQELSVPNNAMVFIYTGRMHPEKGLHELCSAFAELALRLPQAYLMLVGPDEGALTQALAKATAVNDRIRLVGLTAQPERYMAAADIFCLASYREGFGLSLIEAAACGLPCVASHIYGITDAMIDGVTGLLVPAKDVGALCAAMLVLAEQPLLRLEMGAKARDRAEKDFSQDAVVTAWLDFYQRQLRARQLHR